MCYIIPYFQQLITYGQKVVKVCLQLFDTTKLFLHYLSFLIDPLILVINHLFFMAPSKLESEDEPNQR